MSRHAAPRSGVGGPRRLSAHLLLAAAIGLGSLAVLSPGQPSATAAPSPAFTASVTAERTHYDAEGTAERVASSTVTLNVSQTHDLRGRQEVHVTWSGAHPTGGVSTDPNSSEARNQEYPFVLLQCRGVEGKAPKGQVALSPETCWTQTSTERYLASAVATPSWRFDARAQAAQREAVVGAPDPLPEACAGLSQSAAARWLPFRAHNGTTYPGGPDPDAGCAGLPPESDNAEAGGLPSNTTYGVTGTDGKGQTDFAVWSSAENGSLGCSPTVSCALVAVPIVGLSCDAWATQSGVPQTTSAGNPLTPTQMQNADATCRRTGAYQPGEGRSSASTDQAVRGNLWWSPSNWENRITVPLTFAQTGAVCDVVSSAAPEQIMGSVAMNELTASWRPAFCTDPDLFTFSHVQQSDALARSLVDTGAVDAAFTTASPDQGYTSPVVQAPTAFTGFAIAFTIDDGQHQRVEDLKLNARLVAKLLTSSYPGMSVVKDNHPSIGGNPMNISVDPEFQALNPGLPQSTLLESAAALQITSASSDILWSLTAWLNADPEARTWLDGAADPWGMRVNANYQAMDLPVDNWPLKDDFVAPDWYQDQNACYRKSPTPMMQLLSNPAGSLGNILVNLQFGSSAAQIVCRYDGYDETTLPLKPQGRQNVGYRFVLGLTSLSAAKRYNLRTAALQSHSEASTRAPFTDATGRTFVVPSGDSLAAAAALLVPDEDLATWRLNYPKLSTEAGTRAYPGAMPVYTVVRTQGLEAGSAGKLADFLCYAQGNGQVSGLANGQLPDGYLPMTEETNLGTQRARLLTAALAVRAQNGDTPALDAEVPTRAEACGTGDETPTSSPSASPSNQPTPTTASPDVPDGNSTGPAGPGTDNGGGVVAPVVPSPVAAPDQKAPSRATEPTLLTDATARTAGMSSGFGAFGGTGLLVLAALAAAAGVLLRWPTAGRDALRAGVAGGRSLAAAARSSWQARRDSGPGRQDGPR